MRVVLDYFISNMWGFSMYFQNVESWKQRLRLVHRVRGGHSFRRGRSWFRQATGCYAIYILAVGSAWWVAFYYIILYLYYFLCQTEMCYIRTLLNVIRLNPLWANKPIGVVTIVTTYMFILISRLDNATYIMR